MVYILEIVSSISLLLMVLVMIAFRRSAFNFNGQAIHHIMAGVFWIVTASVFRGLFWDIVPEVMGREDFRDMIRIFSPSTWPNILFYLMKGLAGIRFLYGFWLLLPEEDRKNYNIITAAFYPKRLFKKGGER